MVGGGRGVKRGTSGAICSGNERVLSRRKEWGNYKEERTWDPSENLTPLDVQKAGSRVSLRLSLRVFRSMLDAEFKNLLGSAQLKLCVV